MLVKNTFLKMSINLEIEKYDNVYSVAAFLKEDIFKYNTIHFKCYVIFVTETFA